jgi:hypothetical protein
MSWNSGGARQIFMNIKRYQDKRANEMTIRFVFSLSLARSFLQPTNKQNINCHTVTLPFTRAAAAATVKEFILFDLIKGIIAGNLQSRKEKESERWRLPGG